MICGWKLQSCRNSAWPAGLSESRQVSSARVSIGVELQVQLWAREKWRLRFVLFTVLFNSTKVRIGYACRLIWRPTIQATNDGSLQSGFARKREKSSMRRAWAYFADISGKIQPELDTTWGAMDAHILLWYPLLWDYQHTVSTHMIMRVPCS